MEGAAMLLKLGGHISNCLERAANAEQRALQTTSSVNRSDNESLAQGWRHLALSYQFVESLERFLMETASSKKNVPPPEMLAIVNEQLAASVVMKEQTAPPESKPIARRQRVKHATSFKDRLLQSAQDARAQAGRLPPGSARERLLQKARESETAANINTWISSPGAPPPDHPDLGKKPNP
jgi:hypothetical protein